MYSRNRRNQPSSQIPEVNLVPMMDVIMTILTFFIIVSMTLTGNNSALKINLPKADAPPASKEKTPDPLMVSLSNTGQISVGSQLVSEADLISQVQTYLSKSPEGAVLLKADNKVAYEQLAKLLGKLQQAGGDRVSLAIESP
ncbi:MAG: biopolymer transporter ExbD [Limnothrix sp. CACIAM 69d]|nr:MAG: biopolymer transporter ExbD [Limnothrix sp. CACIAM 69d]